MGHVVNDNWLPERVRPSRESGKPEVGSIAGQAEDDLERALLQVREMIETTVTKHRDLRSRDQQITTITGGYEEVLTTAGDLVKSAEVSIDIIHARNLGPGDRTAGSEREQIYGARPGVVTRLLSHPALLDEDFVREQLGKERPVAIRVARVPPLQGVIIDGKVGLMVAESAVGRRASVIRVPEVIHTLRILFDGVWRNAVPANERIVFGGRDRAALARQILGALRAGVTDEVAARELTVSVRTYRRHVAEIMNLMGAKSRFQAGVRAAELGLIPAPAGPRPQGGPRPE
ncbi:LuxR family transcriptional regulator [Streptomyces sp. NPDC050504]|uniref:LuxR family transcriptional regulator n=1 Tax=Streptomyces sp. NPDC050504 TaxID=3365618 RepID=UPI0037BC423E